jgi:A/G-specific adenine glycosylase
LALATSSAVAAALRPWFRRHRRRFSFRVRPTPYKALLAEPLLRKTRAADADRVFPELWKRYPTPTALASANEAELRFLISPLGLPDRARTYVALGKALVERHRGRIPETARELEALPGIGRYAAGAILCIGYNRPAPMVDSSIGRVLRRLGGISEQGRAAYYDERVWALAKRLVPTDGVRDFQLALLDTGALVCRPKRPLCLSCPLSKICSHARTRSVGTS